MKIFVVDGYNVIHSIPEFEKILNQSLRHAREALIQICFNYVQSQSEIRHLYLVYDGKDEFADLPVDSRQKLTILFSGTKEEADGRIIDMLQSRKSPDDWWVVSRDNEIINNAKSMGAKFISPLDFLTGMNSKSVSAKSPVVSRKGLSDSLAKKITDEYRKHLGI